MADYFDDMLVYAQRASAGTGIPVSVILAQWANESAYGKSDFALNHNNHGGIKYTSNADYEVDGHAGYYSVNRFVDDYIRVMNLSYYQAVVAAGSTPGVNDDFEALGESPYAGSGYGREDGGPGRWLKDLWLQWSLSKYDNPGQGGQNVSPGQVVAATWDGQALIITGAALMALFALLGLAGGRGQGDG